MSEHIIFIGVVAMPFVAMLAGHGLVFFLQWRHSQKRRREVSP